MEESNMKLKDIKLVHQGNYLSYYVLDYTDKDGNIKPYEMVSKQGSKLGRTDELTASSIGNIGTAVILLVLNEDNSKILLSKEFRMGVNHWVYNDVAGLIEPGETVGQAAARELFEETGLKITKIRDILPATFTCAPVTDDVTTLVICNAEGNPIDCNQPYEQIKSAWYSKEEARELMRDKNNIFGGRLQAFIYMWINEGKL